ncbi:thiazole tautomerase TenI [Bacillus lacus]|uniref:Thiazole tautomerase TenI n=1 Tax=Metabacillus lacus TaxID=1983721 RepID=A0A7X2J1T6_9BACI|nr:thiazole tautomerase TenI [Metabacillus lacus]MRX73709.1 thiazole tautomerase TenI [Metabacillus lacus]
MKLHVITDGKKSIKELAEIILSIHNEIDYIHIRERGKSAGELSKLLFTLNELDVPSGKLIMNDRLDVALLHGLRGIQLPHHSFSPEQVRQMVPHMKIGSSVHSMKEAEAAEKAGADYLLFGHIYSTGSKENIQPRGLKQLMELSSAVEIPVVAIGGISPEKIKEVKAAGADGIAVMSYVFSAGNPSKAVQSLREEMEKLEQQSYI